MWCSQCQQDVPGSYSATRKTYICPRCNEGLVDGASGCDSSIARNASSLPAAAERPMPSIGPAARTVRGKGGPVGLNAPGISTHGANPAEINTQSLRPFPQLAAKKFLDARVRLDSAERVPPAQTQPPAAADPPVDYHYSADLPEEAPPSSMDEIPPTALTYDGWELDEQLRHIDRLLATTVLAEAKTPDFVELSMDGVEEETSEPDIGDETVEHLGAEAGEESKNQIRLDTAHHESAQRRHSLAQQRRSEKRRAKKPRAKKRQAEERAPKNDDSDTGVDLPLHRVTWGLLSGGLTIFACGGLLLIWSAWTGRQDLWTMGWPITMVGQICLAVGGILLADRLWHESSATAAKLDNVDQRLADMRTIGLEPDPFSPTDVHSAHPLEDMSPRLLLADLKNQIDQLSAKLDQSPGLSDADDLVA